MNTASYLQGISRRERETGARALHEAILAAFVLDRDSAIEKLSGFYEPEWRRALEWLDVSGMALYFLERMWQLGADCILPQAMETMLADRLQRNRGRMRNLQQEAFALAERFEQAGLRYALLKGITLAPDAVPDMALRSQADLDFLIPADQRDLAVRHICAAGYELRVDKRTTLEFRAAAFDAPGLARLYSAQAPRALDLHLASEVEVQKGLLARGVQRSIDGTRLYVLAPADILVQQAQHLLQHLCSEFTRLSWVLEFRQHVLMRWRDVQFWREAREIAREQENGDLAMGIAFWLARDVFGDLPAEVGVLAQWQAGALPARVRLWLELYSRRVLLSSGLRTKLYALLRKEVACGPHGRRSTHAILFPRCLPRRVMDRPPGESMAGKVVRMGIEMRFFLHRLRFHVVEGLRFGIEANRWKRAVATLHAEEAEEHQSIARMMKRAGCVSLLVFAGVSGCGVLAHAQAASPSGFGAVSSESSTDVNSSQDQVKDDGARVVMPAYDLIQLLQNNPQIMVECKSAVSDFLAQQGNAVSPDALTDEQVYNAITASAILRKRLTQSLVSTGYVTEEQVLQAAERPQGNVGGAMLRGGRMSAGDAGPDLLQTVTEGYGDNGVPQSFNPSGSERNSQRGASEAEGQQSQARNSAAPRNVTDEPEVLRRPAPYNLLALRDLYTQVPETAEKLKRFGSDVFITRGAPSGSGLVANSGASVLDVPVGPDYVLGPGDELSISIWGGVSQNLVRVVNREGNVALPEAGLVQVAGLPMAKAQGLIEESLRSQYRDAHVAVTVARLRTIRIFVVGDVQRPGSYEISSVASPVNALYAAGGPTAVGSLRTLRHYREGKLVGDIDLYDFLLHGVTSDADRLQSGDTLLVPPVGTQVAVFGAVKRPAIYELRNEKTLSEVLMCAGGVTAAAALSRITVDRVVPNLGRQEIGLNAGFHEDPKLTEARLGRFEVDDGDRIHVASVLPVNDSVVYLQGHVARPGKIAYRANMRVSDVLTSYADMLPEPADTGEIVRLIAPDMHPETIQFNIPDVLIGNSPMMLQPFDTIRIFGRYEQDAPTVTIRGEVQRPGDYPLFEGMTAAQLVRAAGGFKRDALLSRADLTSYQVMNGSRISVNRRDVPIGSVVLKDDGAADVKLKAGDVLTVHQLSGWNDVGASITIDGEVAHPGSYGFQEGEHLSDVLKRAGGFRDAAYPEGAVLTRTEVAALEEKSRQELVRQIETSSAAARLSTRSANNNEGAALQLIQQQQEQVLAQLKSERPSGRLVIHITQDINRWAGTAADIEVRRGDVLKIPKRPGFILVSGQVYNASAITYTPGKTAGWYLQKAGGATQIADRKHIFVVRANGEVIGQHPTEWYERDVLSTRLEAGDTVVVPQKIQGPSMLLRNLLAAAQVAASVTIAASVAGL